MELNLKCMLLGRESGKKKDGGDWRSLRFLDKSSGEEIFCFVDSFGKYEKVPLYTDTDCKFSLQNKYDSKLKAKIWKFFVEV